MALVMGVTAVNIEVEEVVVVVARGLTTASMPADVAEVVVSGVPAVAAAPPPAGEDVIVSSSNGVAVRDRECRLGLLANVEARDVPSPVSAGERWFDRCPSLDGAGVLLVVCTGATGELC